MRHINVTGAEFRIGKRLAGRDGAAENSELIAKAAAIDGRQIAGVIPPFGLEIRMGAVVARELPVPRLNGAGIAIDSPWRRGGFKLRTGAKGCITRRLDQTQAKNDHQQHAKQDSSDAPVHL